MDDLNRWESERELTIPQAAHVLAMLAIEHGSPGRPLDKILRAAGAGSNVSPDAYAAELIAFSAHVTLVAFGMYAPQHGSITAFHAMEIITNSLPDYELGLTVSDRRGEYNIAGQVTRAAPEAEWTIGELVGAFWENLRTGSRLPPDTAEILENWVRGHLALGKKTFSTVTIIAE